MNEWKSEWSSWIHPLPSISTAAISFYQLSHSQFRNPIVEISQLISLLLGLQSPPPAPLQFISHTAARVSFMNPKNLIMIMSLPCLKHFSDSEWLPWFDVLVCSCCPSTIITIKNALGWTIMTWSPYTQPIFCLHFQHLCSSFFSHPYMLLWSYWT